MKQTSKFKLSALAVATTLAIAPTAFATNGYFATGYGAKSNGMAGAGIALPQDAIAPATNPAGISWTGSRVDAGLMLFNPLRDAGVDATAIGGDPASYDSGATLFAVPSAGFVMDMAGDMTMGFTMYGNGGMNTRYNSNTYFDALANAVPGFVTNLVNAYDEDADSNTCCNANQSAIIAVAGGLAADPDSSSTLGVNLAQLILAPSVSTKLGDNNSIGASLLVGYQRFRAYGLGFFKGFSSDMNNVTNRGDDDAWGYGARLGWTGNVTDSVTVGATYSTKIYMQEFDKYKGLFAENGAFDIPSNYGIGITFKPNSDLAFTLDVERILYGDVASIANAGPTANEFFNDLSAALTSMTSSPVPYTGKNLGTNGGYGFGWENITVYKLGMSYAYNDQWTLRGGFNIGDNPIPSSENFFNVIAPGVMKKHLTLGFTYAPDNSTEITVNAMHAFREEQSYSYVGTGGYAGYSYDTEIGMSQNAFEVSYGLKF